MTEDYKKKLLEYFTGNYDIETPPSNDLEWSNVENIQNNLDSYLDDEFSNYQTHTIDGQVTNQSYVIMYGRYGAYATLENAYILILDETFTPLQLIKTFNTGTPLNYIQKMGVGEDNRFFMIDYVNGQYRFCLLNNILAKKEGEDYSIVLRNSYFFPSAYNGTTITGRGIQLLEKVPNQAIYLICFDLISVGTLGYPTVLEFKINVGVANEWIEHKYNTQRNFIMSDIYASYNNNTLKFRLSGINYGASTGGTDQTMEYIYDGNSLTERAYNTKSNIYYETDTTAYGIYAVYNGNTVTFKIDIYNLTTSQVQTIWQYSTTFYDFTLNDIIGIYISKIANEIFFEYVYGINSTSYSYNIGRVAKGKVYTHYVGDYPATDAVALSSFFVTKTFNLYNYYIQAKNNVYTIKQIYNEFDYNGEPYQDINSLVPNSCNLYSNNDIIFSRDLYNKTLQRNITTSTVQIPNNFLNSAVITQQDLISKTKNIIVSNQLTIDTNIYETLNINFINSINIKNENNISNVITNVIGATRLNNSVSETTDYIDTKMSKYRINYSDNTNKVVNNIWAPVGNFYRTNINVFVDKEINSIDFISNDENTIYCSISPTLEIGKIYKIKQDVYIDEKIQESEVYYGVDEVFYDNEKVYY